MSNILAELHQKIHVAFRSFLFACTRAEHPKLFGFVRPCDSVYLIALRPYLVKHAHTSILSLKRHYYTPFEHIAQPAHPHYGLKLAFSLQASYIVAYIAAVLYRIPQPLLSTVQCAARNKMFCPRLVKIKGKWCGYSRYSILKRFEG